MNRIKGDIWAFREAFIVIPTNLEGVCGRGLAKQMVDKFEGVGRTLRTEGRSGKLANQWADAEMLQFFTPEAYEAGLTPHTPYYRLVPFPVKRSWKDEADLNMIELSCRKLVALLNQVRNPFYCIMPQVGCGFGELKPENVIPLVEEWMKPADPRVLLIEPDPAVFQQYAGSFKPGWRSDKSAVEANIPPEAGSFGNMGGFPDLPGGPLTNTCRHCGGSTIGNHVCGPEAFRG